MCAATVQASDLNGTALGNTSSQYGVALRNSHEDVVAAVNTLLQSQNLEQGTACCSTIRERIKILETNTASVLTYYNAEVEATTKTLLSLNDSCNKATEELENATRALSESEAELAGLQARQQALQQQLATANQEMQAAQATADRRRRRKKRFAVGMFHSAFDKASGKKKALQNKIAGLSTEQSQLTGRRNQCQQRIEEQKQQMISLTQQKDSIAKEREAIEVRQKQLGKQVTQLKNAALTLAAVCKKYPFLQDDVGTIHEFLKLEENSQTGLLIPPGSDSKTLVDEFLTDLGNTLLGIDLNTTQMGLYLTSLFQHTFDPNDFFEKKPLTCQIDKLN